MQTNLEIEIPPGSIAGQILGVLEANGGVVRGTAALCDQVTGTPWYVRYCLKRLRSQGLVKSKIATPGRGHQSIHRLVTKPLPRSLHSHGGRKANQARRLK
jgi:hypothetical protein